MEQNELENVVDSEDTEDIQVDSDEHIESTVSVDSLVEPMTIQSNNLVYLLSFIIVELGIVIGILLGFVWKGITKK